MTVEILTGDCRAVLQDMPSQSVHCIVTSPPYYGLRDYGTAEWEGGNSACDHKQGRNGSGRADGIVDGRGQRNRDGVGSMGGDCRKCGARRIDSQIGLEQTPEAYIAEMVAVFREARRVLRDDGTLWLNIGDSYAASGTMGKQRGFRPGLSEQGLSSWSTREEYGRIKTAGGTIKPKDLLMIPARVALALRADGWYLRSEIIWAKPNPMPESVRDRPTSAHEKVYLFAKQPRYFYDHEAVKEPAKSGVSSTTKGSDPTAGRNLRNVWTITPAPFKGAHFATMPAALAETCIKAGCPIGGTVLDPFGGAGTTALAARNLGRRSVLIELNAEYAAMAMDRIAGAETAKAKPTKAKSPAKEAPAAPDGQMALF